MRLPAAMSKTKMLRGCEVARLRVKKVLREVPLPPPLAFSATSYRTHSYLLWHSQLSPLAFSAISSGILSYLLPTLTAISSDALWGAAVFAVNILSKLK